MSADSNTIRRRKSRLSWFRFFPDDFFGGIATLSDAESARYLRCLAAQWASAERTAIPADPERLRLICRGNDPGPEVLRKFTPFESDGTQYLRNERLADEWHAAKEEYESRRRGAERTAELRAEHSAIRPEPHPHPQENVLTPLPPKGGPAKAGSNGASRTEQERLRLESDERLRDIADYWSERFGRTGRQLGVLRAAKQAFAAGYEAETLRLVIRTAAACSQNPDRYPPRSSFRWAVDNSRLGPEYLLRPSTLDRLVPEGESWERE